ncbi:MAG TPA: hypothetical protein VFV19_10240 [Candidatus Polarisedimenticolaceae bacterium]|nr:hypothetical protein [Candidatus Polarisedimenticolaceae bacterium]
MTRTRPAIAEFDGLALFRAMDAKRSKEELSWPQVAREIWAQSAALNAKRADHPISPATLTGLGRRGDCTCQHALFMLRWLGEPPERFVPGSKQTRVRPPAVGPHRRLRWDLKALAAALDSERRARELTWAAAAVELRCTSSQLTGIRIARYAIGMRLAMRIVAWLDRPASDFIVAARW